MLYSMQSTLFYIYIHTHTMFCGGYKWSRRHTPYCPRKIRHAKYTSPYTETYAQLTTVVYDMLNVCADTHTHTHKKCWRGCGEKGTLLHCWWECKLVQPLWRTVWTFFKKLEIELPYDPAIPLLGIHIEETRIESDMCAQCSSQHCLQWPGHGSNLDVHRQMNG